MTTQNQLAESYRRQQATLRALVVRDVLALWLRLFDPARARESWVPLRVALEALVRDRAAMSSALAARYYNDSRLLARVPGVFTPPPAPGPDAVVLAGTEDSTGLGSFLRAVKGGQTAEQAQKTAGVTLSGGMSKLVLDAGRDTVTDAVQADPEAIGWARVTDAHPCAFCAMLASRGPAYRSERTASFQAHDHCACVAAAVFSHDEAWLGNSRDLAEQWQTVTAGKSKNDARIAWRQHWEGRTAATTT